MKGIIGKGTIQEGPGYPGPSDLILAGSGETILRGYGAFFAGVS
jgi:hypothetical protein